MREVHRSELGEIYLCKMGVMVGLGLITNESLFDTAKMDLGLTMKRVDEPFKMKMG